MNSSTVDATGADDESFQYSVMDPAPHTLYECETAEEFRSRFETETRCCIANVADDFVDNATPKAIFVVGSLPLGMGSSGSDVDLLVLVDDRAALRSPDTRIANSDKKLGFSNESDPLLAGEFLSLHRGIVVDLQVAITPQIRSIYRRLRRRGPELSEYEIRTLGRLGSGWLLWQSDGYLERNSVVRNDPTLAVYCCTKSFVWALILKRKATKAVDIPDLQLALQLGRSSVEASYLAYFASEGFSYLGAKWLAQIGHARGAKERLARHPLLAQGVQLLFPTPVGSVSEATRYLGEVSEFLAAMKSLIESKVLFRIALKACPQIESA